MGLIDNLRDIMARINAAKVKIALRAFLRTWPEWVALIALLWLFSGVPGVIRHQWHRIAPAWRQLREEGTHRLPPSQYQHLKGAHRVIFWIRQNIPPEAPLFYLGSMSTGIRLRYYTYPRNAHWQYLYSKRDLTPGLEALEEFAPAYVIISYHRAIRGVSIPETWHERFNHAGNTIYEVRHHAEE